MVVMLSRLHIRDSCNGTSLVLLSHQLSQSNPQVSLVALEESVDLVVTATELGPLSGTVTINVIVFSDPPQQLLTSILRKNSTMYLNLPISLRLLLLLRRPLLMTFMNRLLINIITLLLTWLIPFNPICLLSLHQLPPLSLLR